MTAEPKMSANVIYLRYMIFLVSISATFANKSDDHIKEVPNAVESKIIHLLDLRGVMGDMAVNATYKDIKTLNIAGKYNESMLGLLERPVDMNVNKPMQSEKDLFDSHTAIIRQLRSQVERLELSVRDLRSSLDSLHSSLEEIEESSSCNPLINWERVQLINVPGVIPFRVLCDSCGGGLGWTVIQRRFDGSLDFYRNWDSYRYGFGYYDAEFFIGLEYIHRLTISQPYELYIELVDFYNIMYYARYDDFRIGGDDEKFMLKSLGSYSGTAGDALSYNLYNKFSTYDSDNDNWSRGNCANYFESGWWYNSNTNSNLNGRYLRNGESNVRGIWWYPIKGYSSFKSIRMLIRPKYTLR